MIENLKWLLFDFGGCLDSDGLHSRAIFFHFFFQQGLVKNEEWALFQDAYSYADKKVISESLIKDADLSTMNLVMSEYIEQYLERAQEGEIRIVADKITSFQGEYLIRNRAMLLGLAKKFKLGVISNFSGNLEIILKEYQMFNLFDFVLDSYYVGASKPDPKIFREAISKTNCEPFEICYMGDNAIRDIIPATKLKMNTIHIFNPQETRIKTKKCKPTAVVNSLSEIVSLIKPV